jgi:enamine deaminase RidA (YjgF/YER057c/UK114 family)
MAYFIDPSTGANYWYADDGSQTAFMKPGLVAATAAQVEAITNPPPPAPVEADFVAAAQNLMDTGAQSLGYDNILSLASYLNSSNATFKAQAAAGIAWRDAVWTEGYTILAAIKAGTTTAPATTAAFVALLPTVTWPTTATS